MPTTVEKHVFFKSDGGSMDREYQIHLLRDGDTWSVRCYNGKRGACTTEQRAKALTAATEDAARAAVADAIKARLKKAYVPMVGGAEGVPDMLADSGRSGVFVKLLVAVDERATRALARDPAFCLQQKFNGRRRLVEKVGDTIRGINKLGQYTTLPGNIAAEIARIPGDCVIDGELMHDNRLFAFDLLTAETKSLGYMQRYARLAAALPDDGAVCVVPTITGTAMLAEIDRLQAAGAEGVVLRKQDGAYASGEAYKFKNVATVDVVVLRQNAQRSVAIGAFDAQGNTVALGNVTVPVNQSVPEVGTCIEVSYLPDSSVSKLAQPVMLGIAEVEPSACLLAAVQFRRNEAGAA